MTSDILPANDNNPSEEALSLTEKTIAGFGGALLIGIVGTALWLVRVWP